MVKEIVENGKFRFTTLFTDNQSQWWTNDRLVLVMELVYIPVALCLFNTQ